MHRLFAFAGWKWFHELNGFWRPHIWMYKNLAYSLFPIGKKQLGKTPTARCNAEKNWTASTLNRQIRKRQCNYFNVKDFLWINYRFACKIIDVCGCLTSNPACSPARLFFTCTAPRKRGHMETRQKLFAPLRAFWSFHCSDCRREAKNEGEEVLRGTRREL